MKIKNIDVEVNGKLLKSIGVLNGALKERKINFMIVELCKIIKMYPQVLVNAKIDSKKKKDYETDDEIQTEIRKLEEEFSGNGRVLIRPSGTEPLIRVMLEGEDKAYLKEKAENLAQLIEKKLK